MEFYSITFHNTLSKCYETSPGIETKINRDKKLKLVLQPPFYSFLFMYIYVYMWLVRLWKFIFMTYMFEVIKLLYTCGPCRISSFSLFLYFFFSLHSMQYIHSPTKNEDYEDKKDSDTYISYECIQN